MLASGFLNWTGMGDALTMGMEGLANDKGKLGHFVAGKTVKVKQVSLFSRAHATL